MFTAPQRIELVEQPLPELSPDSTGELLFEPMIACLCGSDLPYFELADETGGVKLGQSLHEMIGRVVETTGTRFQQGELVLAVPPDHLGLWQRFVVEESRAIPISKNVPVEQALMAQPLGTALFATRKVDLEAMRSVVIVGQGPMGQLFNSVVKQMSKATVIAIDPLADRLRISPKMGADHVIDSSTKDVIATVMQLTEGMGADLVIEAVGHREQALNLCIDLVRTAGEVLCFGVPPVTIPDLRFRELFMKNITLHTSVYADFEHSFPSAMQWIDEGRIDVSPIITHRFPLAEIQAAFELFHSRQDGAIKVLIDFPEFTPAE